jgi:hypothetical protein
MAKKKTKPAASLAGLVLRRLQDIERDSIEGEDTVVRVKDLKEIFGEALEQLTREEKKAPDEK